MSEVWLAAHDAEIAEKALWRAATAAVTGGEVDESELPLSATRSEIAAWLRARARAERGEVERVVALSPDGPWHALPDDAEADEDPRSAYPELSKRQAWMAWPCVECGVRRGEHADQPLDALPAAAPHLRVSEHLYRPAGIRAERGEA